MKVAIIILAGGQSRRMGVEKSTLQINGISMLQHTINRLPAGFDVAVNANGDISRFGDIGFEIFADSISGFAGPLAGVLSGMEWAKKLNFNYIITIPVDSIFFPDTLIEKFCAAINDDTKIILASSAGKTHPVFAIWDISLQDDLRQFLEQQTSRKIMDFVNRHNWQQIDFEVGQIDPFFNINEKKDLQLAESYLQ